MSYRWEWDVEIGERKKEMGKMGGDAVESKKRKKRKEAEVGVWEWVEREGWSGRERGGVDGW